VGSTTQGDRFLFGGANPINLSDPTGNSSESERSHQVTCAVAGGAVGLAGSAASPVFGAIAGGAFEGGCDVGAWANEEEGSWGEEVASWFE
jgi:hypothetical protein